MTDRLYTARLVDGVEPSQKTINHRNLAAVAISKDGNMPIIIIVYTGPSSTEHWLPLVLFE